MTLKQTLDTIRNYPEPAELLLSHRYLREVNFQDNELKDIQCKEVSGKAVRVIHDGRVGAAPGVFRHRWTGCCPRRRSSPGWDVPRHFDCRKATGHCVK